MKRTSVFAVGLLAAATGAVAAPVMRFQVIGVSITDIGTLGGKSAVAWDINNAGRIVGWAKTSLGDDHAFLYKAGVMYDISPPFSTYSDARAINRFDEVAGHYSLDHSEWHAYRWKGSVSYPLNDSDRSGPGTSRAYGISNTGLIAGEQRSASAIVNSATVWTSDTTYLTLSQATSTTGSNAWDVNAAGMVVGFDSFDDSARRWTLLFWGLFTSDAAPSPYWPAPTIYGFRSNHGVNAMGEVVGQVQCCGIPSNQKRQAWFWDGTSIYSKHLGLLPGGTYSLADDINNERFIAGYGERTAPLTPAYESAFLYHGHFNFYELPRLSPIYKSCRASALNERNSAGVIQLVGVCVASNGEYRAVRWDVKVELVPVVGTTP